ncbi:hypothetical protein KO02_05315 [Sphingobacterium sp. ML3W]|uniref:TlpA family protein disulfide reductase n=1 Tax=Sphingobacterium sp. ML3W TaxID=1538644 RepID=UPI0004F7D1D9|nr:TlpA disulfide reductase family protein [Sphingobacterium sp. ML3W]AIM36178.1 hypothetical protein KO02_05315 [Sphingobacterium sp. ML3W]
MNKILINLLILLLSSSIVSAQKDTDRSQELKVGQHLPKLAAFPVLNYSRGNIDLSTLQGKVVILDFFDTFCVNCIAAMPKLQQLQNELGDKLQVILVTWQDKATIENFYKSNAFLKEHKVALPTIYEDTLLRLYFPHKGVPHTAWLKQGKVQAITFADFAKAEHVEKLYLEGKIHLPLKADFRDESSPVSINKLVDGSLVNLSISGYQDGKMWHGIQIKKDSVTQKRKVSFYNRDILGAYTAALSLIKKPTFVLKEERIKWKVSNPDRYRYLASGDGKNSWLLDHGICYERIDVLDIDTQRVAKVIINDLNNGLGLNVYWSIEEIPCLVLQRLDDDAVIIEKSEDGLEGTEVLVFTIDYLGKFPPVFDEVKSTVNIKVDDYSSLDALNKQLQNQGLVLKKDARKMEVLVFEESE